MVLDEADETVGQIRNAPQNAYYVVVNRESMMVASRIAQHLDRADLRFLILSDLRRPGVGSGRFFVPGKAFVIDHQAASGMLPVHRKVIEQYAAEVHEPPS